MRQAEEKKEKRGGQSILDFVTPIKRRKMAALGCDALRRGKKKKKEKESDCSKRIASP